MDDEHVGESFHLGQCFEGFVHRDLFLRRPPGDSRLLDLQLGWLSNCSSTSATVARHIHTLASKPTRVPTVRSGIPNPAALKSRLIRATGRQQGARSCKSVRSRPCTCRHGARDSRCRSVLKVQHGSGLVTAVGSRFTPAWAPCRCRRGASPQGRGFPMISCCRPSRRAAVLFLQWREATIGGSDDLWQLTQKHRPQAQ